MDVIVSSLSASARSGLLRVGNMRVACALGRSGCRAIKREGDGASPMGRWQIRQIFYRADRMPRPVATCPVSSIRPNDGWCDAPFDANYNRHVRHPYGASAEHLWRADGLYDFVVVLGYNDRPRMQMGGSAIFLHVASSNLGATEGCVAVRRSDLKRLLAVLGKARAVRIVGGTGR